MNDRCQVCGKEATGLYYIDQHHTRRARLCARCADKRVFNGIAARRYLEKRERDPIAEQGVFGE